MSAALELLEGVLADALEGEGVPATPAVVEGLSQAVADWLGSLPREGSVTADMQRVSVNGVPLRAHWSAKTLLGLEHMLRRRR